MMRILSIPGKGYGYEALAYRQAGASSPLPVRLNPYFLSNVGEKGMTEMDKETRSGLKKLTEKRRSIDLLDQKLLKLLNQRVRVALQIGKIKRRIGKKAYDPAREHEVLERLKLRNRGPLKKQDLIRIYRTIMTVCRKSQF